MKLWQKIFLCVLLMMTAAIHLTALLLVRSSHSLLLAREQSRCAAEQETLAAGIANRVMYQRLAQNKLLLDAGAVTALLDESLRAAASDTLGAAVYALEDGVSAALLAEQNAAPIEGYAARGELLEASAYSLLPVEAAGRHYLLTGSVLTLEGRDYALFTASDITVLYEAKAQQMRFIRQMSLGCSVLCALVLLVVVRHLLRPLQRLGQVARTIAGGNYAARAPQTGGAELSCLAADMNVMAESVEEQVRRLTAVAEERRLFIANLSHEMKTPLTSILGFADLLRITQEVPEEQRREYAGIIVEEAGRLKTLSGKLLELLTAGSAALSLERIVLPELLDAAATALRPVVESREMTLSVRAQDRAFSGDAALLKSLLYNLLDNAVKASARGEEILLNGAVEGAWVCLSVTDHGCGMSPQEAAHATEPFYMADKSRSRRAGGAGLGLALCAEIARAHGGTLHIDTAPERGTTVTVRLPGAQKGGKEMKQGLANVVALLAAAAILAGGYVAADRFDRLLTPQPEVVRVPKGENTALVLQADDEATLRLYPFDEWVESACCAGQVSAPFCNAFDCQGKALTQEAFERQLDRWLWDVLLPADVQVIGDPPPLLQNTRYQATNNMFYLPDLPVTVTENGQTASRRLTAAFQTDFAGDIRLFFLSLSPVLSTTDDMRVPPEQVASDLNRQFDDWCQAMLGEGEIANDTMAIQESEAAFNGGNVFARLAARWQNTDAWKAAYWPDVAFFKSVRRECVLYDGEIWFVIQSDTARLVLLYSPALEAFYGGSLRIV